MVSEHARFDFSSARQKLASLQDALTQASGLTAEQTQKQLAERAVLYAAAPGRTLLASEQVDVLKFKLAGESYAIESRFVFEVLRAPGITSVPGTPPLLTGVMNLRGEILAVMDIGNLLGAPHPDLQIPWVLVLGADRPELGIVATSVVEVAALRTDIVLTPTRSTNDASRDWIRGVTAEALVVLEGQVLLDDARLQIDVPEV